MGGSRWAFINLDAPGVPPRFLHSARSQLAFSRRRRDRERPVKAFGEEATKDWRQGVGSVTDLEISSTSLK